MLFICTFEHLMEISLDSVGIFFHHLPELKITFKDSVEYLQKNSVLTVNALKPFFIVNHTENEILMHNNVVGNSGTFLIIIIKCPNKPACWQSAQTDMHIYIFLFKILIFIFPFNFFIYAMIIIILCGSLCNKQIIWNKI